MAKKSSKRSSKKRSRMIGRVLSIVAAVVVLCLLGVIGIMLANDPQLVNNLNPFPSPTPEPTAEPTPAPPLEPVAIVTPKPDTAARVGQEIEVGSVFSLALPDIEGVNITSSVYQGGQQVSAYVPSALTRFTDDAHYSQVDGVTTLRGNNFRNSAAFGQVPNGSTGMRVAYNIDVGSLGDWTGVGWTGQPVSVKWSGEVLQTMNIFTNKKMKAELVEVICPAQDGKVYFFDLDDGQPTRSPIDTGAVIRGSITVDPRGWPILYVGQAIAGEQGDAGLCVYSLIDQTQLMYFSGTDSVASGSGGIGVDCAPLVDGASDTLVWAGKNGVLYVVNLGTQYDAAAGTLTFSSTTSRYVYASDATEKGGVESSIAIYNHYVYLADNSGLLQCVDLDTLQPVWAIDAGYDVDAPIVIEETSADEVLLYVATVLAGSDSSGNVQMRCLNALTGEERWSRDAYLTDTTLGGVFAAPCIGEGSAEGVVMFNVSMGSGGGTIFAINRQNGSVVWQYDLGVFSWSSPVLATDSLGNAYLFVGNAQGMMRMINAETGMLISEVQLEPASIEASPMIYEDMMVVGTRGRTIFGVSIY